MFNKGVCVGKWLLIITPLARVSLPPSQRRGGVVWWIRLLSSLGHLLCSDHSEERQRRIETASVVVHFLFNSLKTLSFPFAFYTLSGDLPAWTILSTHLISTPLIRSPLNAPCLIFSFCLPPSLFSSSLHHLFSLSLLFLCSYNRQKNVSHTVFESFYLFHHLGNGAVV